MTAIRLCPRRCIRPAPINGLTDGVTYVVHRFDSTHVTLRNVGSSIDIPIDAHYNTGSVIAGDDFGSTQQLPVKFGSGDWTCVTGTMQGTFTAPMPAADGKTLAPTGKAKADAAKSP